MASAEVRSLQPTAMRNAILIAAMTEGGLIRFRGHGTEVTFESTLPLEVVIPAVSRFMAEQFGPMTWSASTGSRMAPALASPTRISDARWKQALDTFDS